MSTLLNRLLVAVIAVLTLWTLPALASAQTPPPRHAATTEAAFVGTTGNTSTSTFSASAEYIFRPKAWLIKHNVIGLRGKANGVVTSEALLYAIRAEHTLNTRVSAYGDYRYFQDKFAGVSSRNQVNGGFSFKIAAGPQHVFTADGAFGYLNEQRITGTDVSSATYSTGTTYKWVISKTAELTDEIKLLGTFDRARDWRGAHAIAVTARLTTLLSLKVSSIFRYANFPPPGFRTTDTTTSVALVVSFKRQ